MSRIRPPPRRCGGVSRAALRGRGSWSGRDRDRDRGRGRGWGWGRGRGRGRDRGRGRVRDGDTNLRFGDAHPRAGLALARDSLVESRPG